MNAFFVNIKNLIPYLFFIAIYFVFINIEAHKDKTNYKKDNIIKMNNQTDNNDSKTKVPNPRVVIPVIPYN